VHQSLLSWDGSTRQILEHQAERLTRLARDLDDVSRAEEGRISIDARRQGLRALADDTCSQMRVRYDAASVDLITDVVDIDVYADPLRIAQVLGNLLANA